MDRGPTRMGHWSTIARSLEVTGPSSPWGENFSWGGRTRTSNFPVNSRAVCQLTYTPMPPYHPPHREQPTVTDAQTHSGEQVREGKKSAPPEPLGAGGARSQSSRDAYPGRVPEFGGPAGVDSSRANESQ